MQIAIIIPARYGSTRFPGKPLHKIAGKPLLERVWKIAKAVQGVSEVIVATDDSRIREFAEKFGADVIMTSPTCRNGSERVFEAANKLSKRPDAVVNFQGDAVLTPPGVIEPLIAALQSGAELVTPAVRVSSEKVDEILKNGIGKRGGTYVATNLAGEALYFSRYPIPFNRAGPANLVKKHIGIYGYSLPTLARYVSLSPTPLEEAEQLEQLRALEHGIPISVVEVEFKGRTLCSIDTPADVLEAEAIIAREGELV